MSAPYSIFSSRVTVVHVGPHFHLKCRVLSISGAKPRRVFSGEFEPSSENAFTALTTFAEHEPIGDAIPIFVIALNDEKVETVLYGFSRKLIPVPRKIDRERSDIIAPVVLIFEEHQPREDLSYIVIDERTVFAAAKLLALVETGTKP